MRMVVIADIHGNLGALQRIMDSVSWKKDDVIICPGDFTDMSAVPQNFDQSDVADMAIQKLLIPHLPLFCVPGNHDPYEIVDLFSEYRTNLHNRKEKKGTITFVGWGGAATPFNTNFEPTEEETLTSLSALTENIGGLWVLVVHAPPKGTSLDVIGGGTHVGSSSIRKTIEEKKPSLVISAHVHENSGTDTIGKSVVFYPGPAYSGFYGIVEMKNGKPSCTTHRVPVRSDGS